VFTEYKDAIIRCEIHILARLGFNVHVQHPHGFMILLSTCWNSLNDLVQTEVVAYFQPNVIACAVIYYGARIYKVSLPVLPPWWELFDAELHEIETICEHLGHLYHQKDK
ncbi:cyclin-like protein, partial [Obelidium mucronatum]